jgi:hypothetical protein
VTLRAFGARSTAYILNSSPSQARFTQSTPMSRPCDMSYEGPRKHHPRALGFDDVVRDLRCSCVPFEGPNAKGGDLDLDVGILCNIYGGAC